MTASGHTLSALAVQSRCPSKYRLWDPASLANTYLAHWSFPRTRWPLRATWRGSPGTSIGGLQERQARDTDYLRATMKRDAVE